MSGETLQGRRMPDAKFGEPGPGWEAWRDAQPGDYMLVDYDGKPNLWIRDPWGSYGRCSTHRIDVHEDSTITVSPSIWDRDGGPPSAAEMEKMGIRAIINPDAGGWHGWLERGVWRSV